MIRVLIKHPGLSSAMSATFADSCIVAAHDAAESGDLVITTTQDTAPADCAVLSARGVHVVVLASHPKESERAQYELSGAAQYIDMTADAGALIRAVTMESAMTRDGR